MDFAVTLSQHVDASPGGTEAFAKVSTEKLYQFPFACATNTSGTYYGLEFCCTHWFTDRYSLNFTGSKEGDVVCYAFGRFKRATVF